MRSGIIHVMFRAGLLIVGVAACGFEVQGTPGDGSVDPRTDASVDSSTDAPDPPACVALEIAAGGDHTCARTDDGSVYCWGRGAYGELGIQPLEHRCDVGGVSYYCSTTPASVQLEDAVHLGLGQYHTCAATASGAYCWGANPFGAYGDGTTTGQIFPRWIPSRMGGTLIEGGYNHTCSITAGVVLCAGQNAAGEIGDGTQTPRPSSTAVMTGAVALTLGDYTTCAIDTQQQLVCWGMNTQGQIDASLRNKLTPTLVPGIDDVVAAAAGRDFTCAVRADKTARCWGTNTQGQLGNGTTSLFVQPPVEVQIAGVVGISAERQHACVLDDAGAVSCFGEGYGAQPVQIALPRPARSLTSGMFHDCAITDDGRAYCWGNQDFGQLGNGISASSRTLMPQAVSLCQ